MNSKHASKEGYFPSTLSSPEKRNYLLVVAETVLLVYGTYTLTAELEENLIELCSTERRREIRLCSKKRR